MWCLVRIRISTCFNSETAVNNCILFLIDDCYFDSPSYSINEGESRDIELHISNKFLRKDVYVRLYYEDRDRTLYGELCRHVCVYDVPHTIKTFK